MKEYYAEQGFRAAEAFGRAGGEVFVREVGTLSHPLTHHPYHSPDGFAWGYGGSGPSELAKDILWDYLGEQPHPAMYQDFKGDFIEHLDQDRGWTITEAEIALWLTGWERNHVALADGFGKAE